MATGKAVPVRTTHVEEAADVVLGIIDSQIFIALQTARGGVWSGVGEMGAQRWRDTRRCGMVWRSGDVVIELLPCALRRASALRETRQRTRPHPRGRRWQSQPTRSKRAHRVRREAAEFNGRLRAICERICAADGRPSAGASPGEFGARWYGPGQLPASVVQHVHRV